MFFTVVETIKYFLSLDMKANKKQTNKIPKGSVEKQELDKSDSPLRIYRLPKFLRSFYE